MSERLSKDEASVAEGHLYRYRLAAGFLRPGDVVADIACGVGYGAAILKTKDVEYVGVDKIEPDDEFRKLGTFVSHVNLNRWEPDFEWDVSVSFETLEHVENPVELARILKMASRMVILSTPTRPTKHFNPFHLHDFTVDSVLELFDGWSLVHIEDQPEELSHIFIWERDAA